MLHTYQYFLHRKQPFHSNNLITTAYSVSCCCNCGVAKSHSKFLVMDQASWRRTELLIFRLPTIVHAETHVQHTPLIDSIWPLTSQPGLCIAVSSAPTCYLSVQLTDDNTWVSFNIAICLHIWKRIHFSCIGRRRRLDAHCFQQQSFLHGTAHGHHCHRKSNSFTFLKTAILATVSISGYRHH
jgi:hypothetical protein